MKNQLKISRLNKMSYGVAEMGITSAEVMLRVGLLIFYTNQVGLNPTLAGYALAIGLFWDALIDPLFGKWSDNININGQRRRPFFIPGAIGLSCFIILLFNTPQLETQSSKFLYLLFCYLGVNTFMTVLSIPHTALAGDMTKNTNERTELFAWRLLFGNIGLTIGSSLPAIILYFAISTRNTDSISSFIVAGVIIISTSISFISTKKQDKAVNYKTRDNEEYNYLKTMKSLYANKNFIKLLFAYMIATIGLTFNSTLALYYYKYFLKLEETQVRGVIAFFLFIFCLSIPLWVYAARFFSKIKLITINIFGLGLITIVGYPIFPQKNIFYPMGTALLGGIFVGSIVLMDVLVAEYADKDAKINKKEDSSIGLYFGIWKMVGKFSRAFSLILAGYALSFVGFIAKETPNEQTSFYIALLFGPGVGLFLILSVMILFLSKEKPHA